MSELEDELKGRLLFEKIQEQISPYKKIIRYTEDKYAPYDVVAISGNTLAIRNIKNKDYSSAIIQVDKCNEMIQISNDCNREVLAQFCSITEDDYYYIWNLSQSAYTGLIMAQNTNNPTKECKRYTKSKKVLYYKYKDAIIKGRIK